jgi:Ca-activated chloride channel family protein
VEDVYPKKMPDLFKGSELVLFGRYEGTGPQRITLKGHRGKDTVERTWDQEFAKRQLTNDYLPRLWASRKIGYLLDEIRLHGEDKELKTEVVRLAKRFGILTPYTSFLVIEEDEERIARGEEVRLRPLATRLRESYHRAPAGRGYGGGGFGGYGGAKSAYGADTGEGAVRMSKKLGDMKSSRSSADAVQREAQQFLGAPPAVMDTAQPGGEAVGQSERHAGSVVRYVGSRTFYRTGDRWVDSRWDEKTETVKLTLFSAAYFKVVADHPDASKYFALGKRVVVVLGDTVYETIEPPDAG